MYSEPINILSCFKSNSFVVVKLDFKRFPTAQKIEVLQVNKAEKNDVCKKTLHHIHVLFESYDFETNHCNVEKSVFAS